MNKTLSLAGRKTEIYNQFSHMNNELKKERKGLFQNADVKMVRRSALYKQYTKLIRLYTETQELLDDIFNGED